MLLLAAGSTTEDDITDDYLETGRRAELLAAAHGRRNEEAASEALCRAHGTTTEGAFRTALRSLDLNDLFERAGLTRHQRRALSTWRGILSPAATSGR